MTSPRARTMARLAEQQRLAIKYNDMIEPFVNWETADLVALARLAEAELEARAGEALQQRAERQLVEDILGGPIT